MKSAGRGLGSFGRGISRIKDAAEDCSDKMVSMFKANSHGLLPRCVFTLVGLLMIALGIVALLQDRLFHGIWVWLFVSAPVAILAGAFMIACALFKPDCLDDKWKFRKGRWQ